MELVTILDREDRSCLGTDPEIFVSDSAAEQSYAKGVCVNCPVQRECLVYAMERPALVGVWGGTTSRDRGRMRRG